MFTEPNTDIYLLNAIPLEDNYVNTILFANSTTQYNYFYQRRSKSLTEYSYQRVNKNTIRVGVNYHDLLVCNYMMFRNKSHENKWYYAFIKEYNYINEVTSEIVYEIDVMQTYQFDFEPNMCLVEREHTVSDELFEHIVPENLDTGTDVVVNGINTFSLNNKIYVLVATRTRLGITPLGGEHSGIYTPLDVVFYKDYQSMYADVAIYYNDNGRENDIIYMYSAPALRPWSYIGDSTRIYTATGDFELNSGWTPETGLNGYHPRNKKLFTSPYNFCEVSAFNGSVNTYKYELWNTGNLGKFQIHASIFPTVDVKLYPQGYRSFTYDYENNVSLNDYPECAWSGDPYKVWLAQNKSQIGVSLLTSAVESFTQMRSLGGVGDTMGYASYLYTGDTTVYNTRDRATALHSANALLDTPKAVAGTLAKMNDMQVVSPSVHGNTKSPGYLASQDMFVFSCRAMSIRKEYAEIIDNYFDMYGYKVNTIKKPTFNNRPHWTFIKTVNCTINGTLPANAESQICSILNRGITFWNDGTEVGNYSLDNSPTTT